LPARTGVRRPASARRAREPDEGIAWRVWGCEDPARPMRAIDTLKQQPPTRAAVEAFLQSHTFPIVEDRTVTFAYHGEATAVQLVHWIHGLESAQPFERLPGTDLWYLSMDLPRASRVEYKL